jgi:transcriptional regulator with XRE-family HTH domain
MAENFDTEGFYAALNAARLSRQMTWKDVAEATGVAASTLSRMSQGARPDVNGLAALLKWSRLRAEMFIPGSQAGEAAPIAKITALLRADPHLSRQDAKLMEEIVVSTYNRLRGN